MTAIPLRVVKLGGSLLDLPCLTQRWKAWLARQSVVANLIVCGGGAKAEAARRQAARLNLDQTSLHWMCIDAMEDNARNLRNQLPDIDWLGVGDPVACQVAGNWLVRPRWFMTSIEPCLPGPSLPASDDATSDSIAARVAQWSKADQLVLLKSTRPQPPFPTPREAARRGWVDSCFPCAASGLASVVMVDLRNDPDQDWSFLAGDDSPPRRDP